MFEEPMNDPVFTDYGVAVQATILTHVAGYDDARFEGTGASSRPWNILPAMERFIDINGEDAAFGFYGESIRCFGEEYSGLENYNSSCGSVLLNAAQHYAYSIVATHFLAVCYYAKNYGGDDAFQGWRRRYEDEYCATIAVPTAEQAQSWGG